MTPNHDYTKINCVRYQMNIRLNSWDGLALGRCGSRQKRTQGVGKAERAAVISGPSARSATATRAPWGRHPPLCSPVSRPSARSTHQPPQTKGAPGGSSPWRLRSCPSHLGGTRWWGTWRLSQWRQWLGPWGWTSLQRRAGCDENLPSMATAPRWLRIPDTHAPGCPGPSAPPKWCCALSPALRPVALKDHANPRAWPSVPNPHRDALWKRLEESGPRTLPQPLPIRKVGLPVSRAVSLLRP